MISRAFSYIRLRRCCRLLSSDAKIKQDLRNFEHRPRPDREIV